MLWASAAWVGFCSAELAVVETPISKCERPHPSEPTTLAGDPGSGAPGVGALPVGVTQGEVTPVGVSLVGEPQSEVSQVVLPVGVAAGAPAARLKPEVEVAFYRKYTVALLRRYLRLSMEAGRVPSLLGRELFRGHVTSYKVKSFEDVVIFCYDVERCLRSLHEGELELIKRIALQEYSQGEAAAMLGMSLRHCAQKYARTLDRLTKVLLEARMLEPLKSCQ